jgi:hypothetical protein
MITRGSTGEAGVGVAEGQGVGVATVDLRVTFIVVAAVTGVGAVVAVVAALTTSRFAS